MPGVREYATRILTVAKRHFVTTPLPRDSQPIFALRRKKREASPIFVSL
jgi:hypothetical protein